MKVSLLSLAALLGVTAGFSSVPTTSSVVNTAARRASLTSVQMSSPAVDAAPFAKPPR